MFILVFNYFKTPIEYQSKVLTYGIATAAVLRLVLIVAGVDIGGQRGEEQLRRCCEFCTAGALLK